MYSARLSIGSVSKKAGNFSFLGKRLAHSHALSNTVHDIVAHSGTAKEGESVTVKGHIRNVKTMKSHAFIDVSDGATHHAVNILLPDPKLTTDLHLKVGQAVEVVGEFKKSEVKDNVNEIHCKEMTVIGNVPDKYPIQKKATSMDFLRTLPTLRHRTATVASVFRFRSYLEGCFMDFFRSESFIKVSPPTLTSSDCEGAGELFYVGSTGKKNFFKKNAYLTVSTQLHLEVLAASLNRVWTLTPCFRAENSDTNRHLSEFWMLEAEISHVEHVHQLTQFAQKMLQSVVQSKGEASKTVVGGFEDMSSSYRSQEKVDILSQRWNTLLEDQQWPTITYKQALEIINENKGQETELQWGDTLTTEHEKWLAGTHFQKPVFVTDYPKFQKPFYMRQSSPDVYDSEQPTVACFDLIIPEIGELIGGSLRIHDYQELTREIESRGMDKKALDWYIGLRENGTVPHGGFGMGFERLVMYLSAQDNIRDVIAFPRFPGSCNC
ncbi:asparagine--tRNA ligase, mitochondrial [[Candida] railenensis]|uniref:asparagine--tRNA ligase n=1 Tax=[Candida] railenensis TaxID=45579 RepID=A0A9P0QPR3_9ASCO|nr:asparagine--tRNA ligase, mitochondrial [[Candida] railenensis]